MVLAFYTIANDNTIGMTHRRWRRLADRLEANGEAPNLVARIRACPSDNPRDAPMVVEIILSPAIVARFATAAAADGHLVQIKRFSARGRPGMSMNETTYRLNCRRPGGRIESGGGATRWHGIRVAHRQDDGRGRMALQTCED